MDGYHTLFNALKNIHEQTHWLTCNNRKESFNDILTKRNLKSCSLKTPRISCNLNLQIKNGMTSLIKNDICILKEKKL